MRLGRRAGWAAVVLVVLLVAAGGARRGAAQPAAVFHTQDMWVFFDAGGADDPFQQVLAAADGEAVTLGNGFAFTPLSGATGAAHRADGTPLANVTITAGVLTLPGADGASTHALAAFSTADISGGRRNLEEGDRVTLSFPTVPDLSFDAATVTYAFIQTRMPADPATEAGLAPLQILARRWGQRAVQVLGAAGSGVDVVQTPLLNAAPTLQRPLLIPRRAVERAQRPPYLPGFITYEAKPGVMDPPLPGGLLGAGVDAITRLGEAMGWITRVSAKEFNDRLQAVCTPVCRFRLDGTITARAAHWEFRSTFKSEFMAGSVTGNTIPSQSGFTYSERSTNLRPEPCTVTPGSIEGPFTVTGRYDARNRRILIRFSGEQPGREQYRYTCPRSVNEGTLMDVETPPTSIGRWWSSTNGRVLEFEVCDAIGGHPFRTSFSGGGFTGEVEVGVSLSEARENEDGLECVRAFPALVAP